MSKKEKFIKEEKQASTIKVKTVVIAIVWFATIIGAIIGGWTLRSYDNARVHGEASTMVQIVSKTNQQ